jgi:hypothetical protein
VNIAYYSRTATKQHGHGRRLKARFLMANTLTVGERARPNTLLGISIVINVMAVILGGSLSVHASAHQEYDWTICFFLLSALTAAMALINSKE